MREIDSKKKRKPNQRKWVDSRSRFFATVCSIQDQLPLVCMNIWIPFSEQCHTQSGLQDDLFIPLQDIIVLRPYEPRNAMITLHPSIHEIVVRVENFWCQNESGGNSGKPICRGTVCVTGDTEPLQRLRGFKDTRFTKTHRGSLNGDASGVRGLQHILNGGINIRRLRTSEIYSDKESPNMINFPTRWLCIDYSSTHSFYCPSFPMCVNRSGREDARLNPECLHLQGLFIERRPNNSYDPEAIAIVHGISRKKVGFLPSELSACLAPCMDSGIITLRGEGIYSKVDDKGNSRHRVWFLVEDVIQIPQGPEQAILQRCLAAIPWWVASD
jgi:hypothetical protein